ncbi:Bifunctional homocysteine S-methyltransferase/5,10-methylenetetrahydrofolate reductase [Roseovarius indicus]|uniref:Bifunctional homocysteine S-methyltransferase/5,10-methylenetetrahydrofolate reductase n=3 Tax=Roseovarius indicus TaxID=540747 RepID=A0A5P3ABG6_9RHOB|nr:Bifunctional homocysteine S-methyltransferase/5,10-methylenetetrahydrofolate reductase [Roseovarius indicus]
MVTQMTTYRNNLPQFDNSLMLTDSGLETTLIFHDGLDLPAFAAYPLMETPEGRETLTRYYRRHISIAADHGTGFVLEAPTWRASRDWGAQLGHSPEDLARINRAAIGFLSDLRGAAGSVRPMVISGNIGPRGDGYRPDSAMTAAEAERYHAEQIGWFAQTDVDMVTAVTLSTVAEGVGVIRAAKKVGLPVVVAYTVETDGHLPDGTPLGRAFEETDARTDCAAAYFMVNCAHPDHFRDALEAGSGWLKRIGGVRANASRLSHAELDEAEELDAGNPAELGRDYARLRRLLPNLKVLGGCCGTDHRHVEAIADCCAASHAE